MKLGKIFYCIMRMKTREEDDKGSIKTFWIEECMDGKEGNFGV